MFAQLTPENLLLLIIGLMLFVGPLMLPELPVVVAFVSVAGLTMCMMAVGLFTSDHWLAAGSFFVGVCFFLYGYAHKDIRLASRTCYVIGAVLALGGASYLWG